MKKYILRFLMYVLLMGMIGCTGQQDSEESSSKTSVSPQKEQQVTFIELGSVKCVPCKMMQPVMKNIEKRFGSQVNVIFYDVWTKRDAKYAKKYGIQGIPTQIFLDSTGKEIGRHVGFYSEDKMVLFFESLGLKELKEND